jgi:uncharacterized protein (TIGR03435 family)
MNTIAEYLAGAVNRTVVDETGLTGLWDAHIEWEMSESELDGKSADPVKVVKAAREQLGLDLKRVNRKLKVVVVERSPKE